MIMFANIIIDIKCSAVVDNYRDVLTLRVKGSNITRV
jgi:hypothetical protein